MRYLDWVVSSLTWVASWIIAHPAECWLALSTSLNVMLRLRPAEAWIALAEHRPRLAALIRIVRATGLDPVDAIKGAAALAAARAASASIAGGLHRASDTAQPSARSSDEGTAP